MNYQLILITKGAQVSAGVLVGVLHPQPNPSKPDFVPYWLWQTNLTSVAQIFSMGRKEKKAQAKPMQAILLCATCEPSKLRCNNRSPGKHKAPVYWKVATVPSAQLLSPSVLAYAAHWGLQGNKHCRAPGRCILLRIFVGAISASDFVCLDSKVCFSLRLSSFFPYYTNVHASQRHRQECRDIYLWNTRKWSLLKRLKNTMWWFASIEWHVLGLFKTRICMVRSGYLLHRGIHIGPFGG